MTIKRRLIISYILVFVVPIMMTAFLFLFSAGGLWLFTQSGNHVFVESPTQFNRATEAVHHVVFRSIRAGQTDPSGYTWVIEMFSPQQSYVILKEDNQTYYEYGNGKLASRIKNIPAYVQDRGLTESNRDTYVRSEDGQYYYYEKQNIDGHVYSLYFLSQEMPHGTDEAVERATRGTIIAIILSFFILLALTIYLLTHFVLRYMQRALDLLQLGSTHVREGDLRGHLYYPHDDEVKPVVEAFNMMTKELNQSLQERQQAEENRKELIANMSHDIRTPLTAIRAYVEGLMDNVSNTPEKQERYLKVIQKKAADMDRMINQLFLFSKIELGERALPMEEMDLNRVVAEIVYENEDGWQRDGAVVTLSQSGGTLPVMGNAELWQRIITNLVSNSIKYKTDSIVQIQINTAKADGRISLVVADDGPGVAPDVLPRLKELFYRTDKARSRTGDGSGLGLAIVARAVELMGGTLTFCLVEPHGLCACLELPEKKEEEPHE